MRPYQLVVWGATGFTGRLVCEHIAHDYQGKIRWAIAGRSQAKLDALKADLVSINPACKDIPVLIADSSNQETVDEVASKTDVLLTTAGPFARIGMPLVKACAEKGTHYCDITGEAHFVRASMRGYDAKAKETGAKIIHSCGYDSVPSDLTTLETVRFARQKFGQPPDEVTLLQTMVGGVSGGTVESALALMSEGAETLKQIQVPYSLDPPGSLYASGQGPDSRPSLFPSWSDAAQSWTAPFIMATANEPVVRRSNALLGYAYGENFRFRERMPAGNYLSALGQSAGFGLLGAFFFAASKIGFVRRLLPAAGEGPSKKVQTTGSWKAASYGLIKQAGSLRNQRVLTVLQDPKRDPGYWSTSRMVLEASLCLVMDQEALSKDEVASKTPAGVLTPAAALGHVLTRRLLDAGYTLDIKVL